MSSQSGWLKTVLRIQAPYPRRQILRRCEDEARVARPLDIVDHIEVPSKITVEDERRKLQFPTAVRAGCRGRVPYLQPPSHAYREMSTRG